MANYPLYERLYTEAKSKEDQNIDIRKVCATISAIGTNLSEAEALEHYEEIAALIYHHDLISNNGVQLFQAPYSGQIMFGGKGILYKISHLPSILQRILACYIEFYSQ